MSLAEFLVEFIKKECGYLLYIVLSDKTCYVIDVSGSVANKFVVDINGKEQTVLMKEFDIVKELATLNKNGTNYLAIFSTNAEFKGEIKFSSNGSIMMPSSGIRPGGITNTHTGIELFLSLNIEFTKLVLITDGKTDSKKETMKEHSEKLDKKGTEFEIKAISNKPIDFSSLTSNQEKTMEIPGLELVNMMNKSVDIYTPEFIDEPYRLAISVEKNTKAWSILGIKFSKENPLPVIIHNIINALMKCDLDFSSSSIKEELQTLFIEIGMLLGLLYIKFPDYFLENILKELQSKTNADLSDFVQYGFGLKQQNENFFNFNIPQLLVDYRAQKESFKDATYLLENKGTSLGEECISFFNGIICHVVDSSLLFRLGIYSVDKYGNIFFSYGSNEQAIRQGLRAFFGDKYGFRDSRNSPSVIFGVATQILLYLLCCPEINLDNAYIEKLRKLAMIQCGQKLQNQDKSYGNSFIEIWKTGNLPTTHFSTKQTHADLYLDTKINPLGLSQTLWWAVMMMIIGDGLFDAQMVFYKSTLESENIEPNETSFLQYIRAKYSSKVSGTVKFSTIQEKKKSIITLEDFPEGCTVYEILSHRTTRGYICDARTQVSLEERFRIEKCPWCNEILPDNCFRELNSVNKEDLQNDDPPRFIQEEQRLNATAQEYVPSNVFRQSAIKKQILFVLEGTVGSGKTTFSQSLEKEVEKIGGVCINEGTDKYCVNGMPIKDAVKKVTKVLKGINRIHNNLIVVIIDTCGEKNTGNVIFNYDFDGWEIHRIRPNFDESRIRQYLCWSLRNVLTRPRHTNNGNFFLNPVSAGVAICKKVHTNKAKDLFGQSFVNVSNSNDLYDILNDIGPEASEYQEYLKNCMTIADEVQKCIAIIRQS